MLERIGCASLGGEYRTCEEIRTGSRAQALVVTNLTDCDLVCAGFRTGDNRTIRDALESGEGVLVRRYPYGFIFECIGLLPPDPDINHALYLPISEKADPRTIWPWLGEEWDDYESLLDDIPALVAALVNQHGVRAVFDLPTVTPITITS